MPSLKIMFLYFTVTLGVMFLPVYVALNVSENKSVFPLMSTVVPQIYFLAFSYVLSCAALPLLYDITLHISPFAITA